MRRVASVAAAIPIVGLIGCETTSSSDVSVQEFGASVRDIRQETFTKGIDAYPAVSPSGDEFAYQRYQDGHYDIWVKPTQSQSDSAGRQITFQDTDDRRPAWIGDDRIIFDSWRVDVNKLWSKRATGSGAAKLESRGINPDIDAAVASDATIAFVSQVSERVVTVNDEGRLWRYIETMPTIWTLAPDGSLTLLGRGTSPAWSPDGTKLAFASKADNNYDIYVMDRDGANLLRLTTNKADDVEPCWSPDGRYVAFVSNRSSGRGRPDFNIWVIRADGSSPTQMTIQKGYDGGPAWSSPTPGNPQGRIYFHAERDRDVNIWSIGPDLD